MTNVTVATGYDVSIQGDVTVVADFEVETINVPEQGPPGPPGTSGVNGADGNTIIYGGANPTSAQGKDGDSYINTTTHVMYGPKAGRMAICRCRCLADWSGWSSGTGWSSGAAGSNRQLHHLWFGCSDIECR
jgi:hypothetical protein